MVGRQNTTPGEGERHTGYPWGKCEAIAAISTTAPIIDRVAELDHTARAIRRHMERRSICHRQIGAAVQSGDRGRTHLHPYTGHCDCSRRASSRWRYQRRDHLIRAGHHHAARFGIGMIDGQRAAPGKDIAFSHLAGGEIDAGIALPAPIIDGIVELDRAAGTA